MATKKSYETNYFSPLSFVAVFGSGIRDPRWVKIRIRDKHSGSSTLLLNCLATFFPSSLLTLILRSEK